MGASLNNISISKVITVFPEKKIDDNDNIYRVAEEQTASDLCVVAAQRIIDSTDRDQIGIVLFLTTSPDYRSPASAMVIQKRLNFGVDCIVFDVTIGQNGFGYGLQIGASLLGKSSKNKAIVLFGDTPSKQIDSSFQRKLPFSDCGSAMLLTKDLLKESISFFNYTGSQFFSSYKLAKGGYRGATAQGDLEPYTGLDELSPIKVNLKDFLSQEVAMLCKALLDYAEENDLEEIDRIFCMASSREQINKIIALTGIGEDKFFIPPSYGLSTFSVPSLLYKYSRELDNSRKESKKIIAASFGEGFAVSIVEFVFDFNNVLKPVFSDDYYSEGGVSHQI